MQVGEDVWSQVDVWAWLAKQSVGLQWIRSADSIAANIAEGYGRYSFKENAKFCYYSRGSLRETQTWLTKAANRHLLSPDQADLIHLKLETLRRQLDNYIRSLGKTDSNRLREDTPENDFETDLPPLEEFLAAHEDLP